MKKDSTMKKVGSSERGMSERRRVLIFINILISSIACSMLTTALTTALPPVIKDLGVSVTTGQWLTSGYSLAMAIAMPLTAFLIDRFPTRRLYLSAILVFITGSFLCGISSDFPMMMLGRVIQAVGNGILTSMTQVITLSIFPAEKRGQAMGWYGLSVSAAPIAAPTVAGILVDTVGWRMIFFGVLGIMVIALVYALIVFTDILDNTPKQFDITSFVLSVLAFGGLTLGVGNIGGSSFLSMAVLLPLVIGVLGGLLFARRQLCLKDPFLELRILKNKNYRTSVLGSMLLYFAMMGSSIILPLYAQHTVGVSATRSALMLLPGSLASVLVSPFAGRIYDRIGIRKLFIIGAFGLTVSNLLMMVVTIDMSVWFAGGINAIRNASIGCLMMPLVTWGASSVSKNKTAHATALLTSLRTIAGAMGSAVFVGIMSAVEKNGQATYGTLASIHSIHVTFLAMGSTAAILILVAFLGTRKAVLSVPTMGQVEQ